MAKGNKGKGKAQKRDELERKRDERSRRKVLKKEREIKEYLENDENFVSFKNQLEAVGLKIKDILGDGNCLFRALGDQLNGDHTSHAYHRKNTIQYMKNHRDDFEPFMEDGTTFEKHLTELSKLGTYGGNDSIVAFARNNGVDIVIHQLNNPRWVIHGSQYAKPGQKIELHLAYHNGEHYSSVRSLSDPDTGPAWQYNTKQESVAQSMGKPKENDSKIKKKKEKRNNYDKSNTTPGSDVKLSEKKCINEASQVVMENTGCQDLELVLQTLQDNNYEIDACTMEILQIMCVLEDQDGDGAKGGFSNVITENVANHTDRHDSNVITENVANHTDRESCVEEKSNELYDEKKKETKCTSGESNLEAISSDQLVDKMNYCIEENRNVREGNRKSLDELVGNLRKSCSQESENSPKLHPGARPKQNIPKKTSNKGPHLTNRQRKELARQEKKKRREERRIDEKQQPQNQQTLLENNVNTIVADLGAVSI